MRAVAASFPSVVVAFRAVTGRDGGENLVAVVRKLHGELGRPTNGGRPERSWLVSNAVWLGLEESTPALPVQLRRELAVLAQVALGEGRAEEKKVVRWALDGAELVIRGELAAGREERIAEHLPGIAYLVVLPGLGREGALEVAQRAEELIDLGWERWGLQRGKPMPPLSSGS